MKTVLISGGAGFIGSHLVDHFHNQGDKVVVIDNLYTGDKGYLVSCLSRGIPFIRKDISLCKKEDLLPFKFDVVLHFASPASPIHYMKQPFMTMNANSKGTEFMLDIAVKDNATFLFSSTSEIYGNPYEHPQTESYYGNVNSFGTRSCYDESKRYAEALIYNYIERFKINAKIVRTFNVYGPKMNINDGRAVPTFINQALKGEPITVFGFGTQTRSLCYIDDYIKGILALLESDINYPINIGNPQEITMYELALAIKEFCNSDSEIVFKELPKDDPERRCPDISLARNLLNWEPKTDFTEGLNKTIEYFKKVGGYEC